MIGSNTESLPPYSDSAELSTMKNPFSDITAIDETETPSAANRETSPTRVHSDESWASSQAPMHPAEDDATPSRPIYRRYKRRFFGLLQLVLLNIIVSWDWLTFSALSTTSATYFNVSESSINWLSTGFLFAFVAVSPIVLVTLNKGPKPSIVASAGLILVGNWVRYGATRGGSFGGCMLGQLLIGFAQPFVLAAPTRYSDLWFSERGRVAATAVASLANPLGGALGQLIGPAWVNTAADIPNMVLFTAIISSVAALPAFFIPKGPPTPASASSALPKTPLSQSLTALRKNRAFWLVAIPFAIYVGFFNALSSLINQIMEPFGFTEEEAGIGGALLIVVGLVASAICSPIIDRTHAYRFTIKLLVPVIGISYLAFVFMPATRMIPGPYVILSLLGAASFALVPVALEYMVEITFPASPEVTSVVCWTGGQLLGGLFILIMAALRDDQGVGGDLDRPKGNMHRGLVFEAVLAILTVPIPLLLGVKRFGFGEEGKRRFVGGGGL